MNNKKMSVTHFLPLLQWNNEISGTRDVREKNLNFIHDFIYEWTEYQRDGYLKKLDDSGAGSIAGNWEIVMSRERQEHRIWQARTNPTWGWQYSSNRDEWEWQKHTYKHRYKKWKWSSSELGYLKQYFLRGVARHQCSVGNEYLEDDK